MGKHGRAETTSLVEGLNVIAQRIIDYRGQKLDEMDLDAITAPARPLVLMDELTHTNAPGSRHPKRYLDVQKLVERGIDVSTMRNIQHVERLNDAVAQIARIRVLETVPDSVPDRTVDIKIIDTTPADPMERLHEGKFYLPKTAQRAINNYFSPSNLKCGSGRQPSAPVEAGLNRQYRGAITVRLCPSASMKFRRMPGMQISNNNLHGGRCCHPIWRKTMTIVFSAEAMDKSSVSQVQTGEGGDRNFSDPDCLPFLSSVALGHPIHKSGF
ncbi:histidine kinase [Paenirhodobacter enshiensis]|uniref:histidine kinase n=1 Tax=Paenirhodobacter enshiensis TaxID=1105367 RepID=UPI001B809CAB|nr:hypothetical protein [Paenirhodobacter enshiensis]